eukprot:428374-Pelagomonas_calceolata.AAC.4
MSSGQLPGEVRHVEGKRRGFEQSAQLAIWTGVLDAASWALQFVSRSLCILVHGQDALALLHSHFKCFI